MEKALSTAAGIKNGGSKGSGRMKRMHEQLLFGGCATSNSRGAPHKASVVARASLQSALIPLNPPFLMLADPHASAALRDSAEAPRDGRGAETCNGNN